jgi:L-aspartate oxidase
MHALFDERRYLIPFRATLLPQIFTDCLVIGGGVAGLRAAIEAAGHSEVIVARKGSSQQSNTWGAQGGVAAVRERSDSLEQHVQDTLDAGGGLCDEAAVRRMVEAAPRHIDELVEWGMPFDHEGGPETPLALGREGGHTHRRVLHADGDATGRVLMETLEAKAQQTENIRFFDGCFVLDLVTMDGASPRCIGAVTHHPRYGLQVIWAKATVLAAGGCGQVFRETTNPNLATGDGLALAYRAGAALADLAFVQFHPTTLYIAGAGRCLISEAVRGEGAQIVDAAGYRFMPDHHEDAELAPRDVVSRAILRHMGQIQSAYVYLDCRGVDHFSERFPGIASFLQKFEIDPTRDLVPIHPSAHYMIGGVATDLAARTSLPGLYAVGEAASTGLHGANRLASNSLVEGLVMGAEAGRTCAEVTSENPPAPVKVISDIPISDRSELDLSDVRSSLRSVMWRHVGIERRGPRLAEVEEMIDFWARYTLDKIFDERTGWEVQNMLLLGALITRASAWRAESRGTHFRSDHPERDPDHNAHDVWARGRAEPVLRAPDGSA